MEPAIQFENVTKMYRLGSGPTSLRSALGSLPGRLLSRPGSDGPATVTALDQVSFEIGRGESAGIIGPNGSGKTTSLKLISHITQATRGTIRVNGRVSALIELGAGFHPDLTGRENVYFNGAILGMKRQEIRRRFDAIVHFAGLEQFLDTPVKRYSSGMYCRLGFAVAAHVNPDILLVDEVLAVGDAVFQARCLKRMSELRAGGTTVIFVTHNLGYLQRLCHRAIFLYRGRVLADGSVGQVIQAYRDHPAYRMEGQDALAEQVGDAVTSVESASRSLSAAPPVVITGVRFSSNREMNVAEVRTGAPLTIHVAYQAACPVKDGSVEVWLYGLDGAEYASFATTWDGLGPLCLDGQGEVRLHMDPLCLMPGTYFVNVAISDQDGLEKYDIHWERYRLSVLSGPTAYGLLYQPHRWSVPGVGTGEA